MPELTGDEAGSVANPRGAAPIRVALADDQDILRRGLAALLALETDIDVIGESATCAETLALVEREHPDVLLLDVQMPAGTLADGTPGPADGLVVADTLAGNTAAGAATGRDTGGAGRTRVIVLTTFGRAGYLRRTLEAGALGFLVKDSPVERLTDGIRRVHAGLRAVDPELAAQSLATGPNPLTDAEARVLRAAADGAPNAQVAAAVYLSEGTVRNYISTAMGKLGAANRAEAVRLATENGWL